MQMILSRSRWLRFGSFSAFYFAQGVPLGLLSIALPAWLAEKGMSAGTIAVFVGWVGLPWALKLIAGPFMDRFTFLPMGFRRPWVLAMQTGLVLSLLFLAFVGAGFEADAEGSLALLTIAGVLVNTFAAVQDVAVDGMAIDVLPEGERGRANAFMGFGQMAASSAFGALCGTLLTIGGISAGALACAITVALILVLAAIVRERPGERLVPWSKGEAAPRAGEQPRFFANTVNVLRVFFLPMSLIAIAVEFVSRLRDGMALVLFPVFATQELALTTEQFTWFHGVVAFSAAAFVVLLGPFIDRFGAKRFLGIALIGSALCHLAMGALPAIWGNQTFLAVLYCLSALLTQMVFVAVIALFMNLCWSRVAATQFAAYMALANLSRSLGAWLLGAMDGYLDHAEQFLTMGALLLFSAGVLAFLNLESHQQRLARFEAQPATRPSRSGSTENRGAFPQWLGEAWLARLPGRAKSR